jgi:hypothetical protein
MRSSIGSLVVSRTRIDNSTTSLNRRRLGNSKLTATLDKRDGFGGIWSTSFDTNWGHPTIALGYPLTADPETMLCTLGFPGVLAGGLSQAFPFINKSPTSGRGRRIFTSESPEGEPHAEDATKLSGVYYKVGTALVLALCVVLLGHLFWQKMKQRKASQAVKAQLKEERLKQDCNMPQYSDDV